MEIGTPLFAIAIAQAVTYYRTYPNDSTFNKAYIGVLLSIDLAHVVTVAHASFVWYLRDRLKERMPSLLASGFFAYPVVTLVQLAYGRRVWYLSRHNKTLCVFIVSASVIQCVSGMAMNVVLLTDTSVHSMHSTAGEALGGIQLATSLLCDILITGSLVYFLRQGRSSSFRSTRDVVDTLVLYSINIGLVTSILAIITLFIWFTMPQNFIFSTFHIIISKFYINSLLVSLNARRSLRQSTEVDTEGYNLRTIQEMVFSSATQ
ncbi:hypothetical protein BDN71DRAFT_775611 [Pleurotus eryngii]|uniref:DUF6534 domain-containing protein n=1 Tax=Pleurotus eryngii TaxID=5323 RepID=A0A9P6DHD5_PLEER|nr:hypothetical protein BDN71DRAFT_775611 [Pleurotus eryngii]